MANALDTFREQRAAAGEVHAALKETSELVRGLQGQINALTRIEELRALLDQEDRCLRETERVLGDVRRAHDEQIRRLRPAVVRRWALPLLFAWACAFAAGAGYVWAAHPYQAELAAVRTRLEFADFVERRVITMTAAERRQFDALMKTRNPDKR
jgi:hypothetical protein